MTQHYKQRSIAKWSAWLCLWIVLPASWLYSNQEPGEVDKLASTNSAWTIAGAPGKQQASKGKVFEREESERVRAQVKSVIRQKEQLWQELVKHLTDDRHCGLVGIDAGYPRNWSVSDVCQHIIGDALSAPFYKHFPGTKANYNRFKMPAFAKDKEKLAKWCSDRQDRHLYELQIEACEWAIRELAAPETRDSDIGDANVTELTAKIKKEIETLRTTKTAVPIPSVYGIH